MSARSYCCCLQGSIFFPKRLLISTRPHGVASHIPLSYCCKSVKSPCDVVERLAFIQSDVVERLAFIQGDVVERLAFIQRDVVERLTFIQGDVVERLAFIQGDAGRKVFFWGVGW
jgi:hypothetical protein